MKPSMKQTKQALKHWEHISRSIADLAVKTYQAKSDDQSNVTFLAGSIMVASYLVPGTSSTSPVHT